MVVRVKPHKEEVSLDEVANGFAAKLSEFRELKWEEALAKVPIIELQGHMSDLDIITDAVLCDDVTQEGLKTMCATIQQLAWTKMRKRLLDGVHFWYKQKLSNIAAGKALLAISEAKRNGTITDAEFEEIEDDLAKQFDATVEHIQQAGEQSDSIEPTEPAPILLIDTIDETTAEEAIAQAMAEESETNIGPVEQGS